MRKNIVFICLTLIAVFAVLAFSACTVVSGNKYKGPYSEVNGAYAAVDDLGRAVTLNAEKPQNEKTVGVFYFLWQGEHGTGGPYDNEKIVASDPSAILTEANWLKAGGGYQGEHSFWGEPLFGYYKSSDKWVMRKHCQMLIDAGVDFILIDTTNAFTYAERVSDLLSVWTEFSLQGFDVPKIAFYTNSNSGATMASLYNGIYTNPNFAPFCENLDEMWFKWDGKPMIVGVASEATRELRNYFTIKESQWPNAPRTNNGFPWMEFSRSLTSGAVYGIDGRKEVINVSVAQHSSTIKFSETAWYGGNDRTRSWHNGQNDSSENALLYGYNFAEQWEFALKQDTEMIFITGWNEWVAQRQAPHYDNAKGEIVFVDAADPNNSRDVEPTAGAMGDNYYIQMADYINKYKGSNNRVYVGDGTTIDIDGDFSQWDSPSITAKYLDYTDDTVNRYVVGFGTEYYRDATGRNDFFNLKTARDAQKIYFYADTASDIVFKGDKPMILYLNTGLDDKTAWYGYDFRVSITAAGAVLQKYDGTTWQTESAVSCKISGNKIMLSVLRDALGIGTSVNDDIIDLQFKWTDNCDEEIWSFYKNGDCAPLGRMNYVFSEKK